MAVCTGSGYHQSLDEMAACGSCSRVLAPDVSSRDVVGLHLVTYLTLRKDKATPAHTLIALAQCEEARARRYAADNPSLPLAQMVALAHDEDFSVRLNIASNPALTRELVRHLREDDNPAVREAASANLGASPILGSLADEQLHDPASDPTTSPGLLVHLAESPIESVRLAVATNPASPPGALTILSEDKAYRVAHAANEAIATWFETRLGVTASNIHARDMLVKTSWWILRPESIEVTSTLAAFPNP